jgi:hypothetical protein
MRRVAVRAAGALVAAGVVVAGVVVAGLAAGSGPAMAGGPSRALPGVIVDYAVPQNVKVRPSTFRPYKDVEFTHVHWTRLNATSGAATGTMRVNTCDPACASAHYVSEPATLTFRTVTKARRPYFNCGAAAVRPGPVSRLLGKTRITLELSPAATAPTPRIHCGG